MVKILQHREIKTRQGHTISKNQRQDLMPGTFRSRIISLSHYVKETSNKDGTNTVVGMLFSCTVVPIITPIESKLDLTQLSLPHPRKRGH